MKNILLIFGGDNVEREISVLTANQAFNYLNKKKYNIIPCYLLEGVFRTYSGTDWQTPSFFAKSKLKKESIISMVNGGIKFIKHGFVYKKIDIDCALVCAHGGSGENGGLQGMLELHNIPYTSCSVYPSAVCMDKWLTYITLKSANIDVCKTIKLVKDEEVNLQDILDQLGGKVIVKPNSLGSSIGVGKASTAQELKACIDNAFKYDKAVLVQEKVENLIEYNCAAFKSSVGVIISEIESPISQSDVLDFKDKYMSSGNMDGLVRDFPAKIDNALGGKIKSITMNVYKYLDLLGAVRIDFLYNKVTKKLYLNEINTIPGSLAYYLFFGTGYTPERMLDEMINVAIDRYDSQVKLITKIDSGVLALGSAGNKGGKL